MRPRKTHMTIAVFIVVLFVMLFATVVQPNLFASNELQFIQPTTLIEEPIPPASLAPPAPTDKVEKGYFNIHQNYDLTQYPKTSPGSTTNPHRKREDVNIPNAGSITITTTQMNELPQQQQIVTSSVSAQSSKSVTSSNQIGQNDGQKDNNSNQRDKDSLQSIDSSNIMKLGEISSTKLPNQYLKVTGSRTLKFNDQKAYEMLMDQQQIIATIKKGHENSKPIPPKRKEGRPNQNNKKLGSNE